MVLHVWQGIIALAGGLNIIDIEYKIHMNRFVHAEDLSACDFFLNFAEISLHFGKAVVY